MTEKTGMRMIGYGRVSTAEQASTGAGMAAQESAIRAEAERRSWTVVEMIRDEAASGRSLKRPGIVRVLERLRAGDAEAVVVAKLDRLSRSMLDFASLMAMASDEGWSIVALDCAVDTTTPAGEAMANVMATFAQFERRLIGQRTREALAIKKAEGVRLGRKRRIPPEIEQLIRARRSAGASLRDIARELDEAGIPTAEQRGPWRPTTIAHVLQRDS